MRAVLISTSLLFGLWLILSGHYTPFFISIGLLCSLGCALIAQRMQILDTEGLPMNILIRLPRITLWFIWQIIKADWNVIAVILKQKPANPRFIKISTNHKTTAAFVTHANFITLTPGTVTIDVNETSNTIFIHALNEDFANMDELQAFTRRIYGLEA